MVDRIRKIIQYNNWAVLFLLILVFSLLAYLTYFLIVRAIRKRESELQEAARNRVKTESKRYLYLQKVDQYLSQHSVEYLMAVYTYRIPFKSKTLYDNRNESRCIKNKIDENKESILDILRKASWNRKLLNKYNELLLKAPAFDTENEDIRYKKAESSMVKELEESIKPVIPSFVFYFVYISPQGRNYYQSEQELDLHGMVDYLTQIKIEIENKETAKYQRSQMTQTLRYDVMKRDHFRCVLCGRSADDGVKLHVDHIVPVAKGGKTVMSNLRTLCEDCNRGKRDKYDENGEN